MLEELAARSGGTAWTIGSMLFFLVAWVAILVWVVRKRSGEMEARARLPLEEDDGQNGTRGSGTADREG